MDGDFCIYRRLASLREAIGRSVCHIVAELQLGELFGDRADSKLCRCRVVCWDVKQQPLTGYHDCTADMSGNTFIMIGLDVAPAR
jgi:hypothetical protein